MTAPTSSPPPREFPTTQIAAAASGSYRAVQLSSDAPWPSGFARYRITRELGRGGMGSVRLADDPAFRRELAIKFLHDAQNVRARAAFIEEAQITGQLEHPNIVPVHDLGTDPDGRPFLAMKRVQGQTLDDDLKRRTAGTGHPWRTDEAHLLAIFAKIVEAIAYAHARGVIHRDLKPANIMLGEFGEVLVMDWGLAKPLAIDDLRRPPVRTDRRDSPSATALLPAADALADASPITTIDGISFGTPGYMPPEQAHGNLAAIDERADIFTLGGILYAMLTGDCPYVGATLETVMAQAREARVMAPRTRAPHRRIPRDLDAIAMKALSREPENRYRAAFDLLADVRAYQANQRISARRDSLATALVKWMRRHPQATMATVLLLAAALVFSILAGQLIARAEKAEHERRIAAEKRAADERAARLEATRRVEQILSEAAISAARGDWETAETTAVRATELLAAVELAEDLGSDVHARVAEYSREKRLQVALGQLRSMRETRAFDNSDNSEKYRAAFRELGVDFAAQSPESIAAHLATYRLEHRQVLLDAIDDWTVPLRPDVADFELRRQALTAAMLGAAIPWRRDLRAAILADDEAAMDRLAQELLAGQHPAHDFVLLADAVHNKPVGRRVGDAVLQKGYADHPGDFMLNFMLANGGVLSDRPPRPEQMERFLTHGRIAVALRPHNAEVRITMALLYRRHASMPSGPRMRPPDGPFGGPNNRPTREVLRGESAAEQFAAALECPIADPLLTDALHAAIAWEEGAYEIAYMMAAKITSESADLSHRVRLILGPILR